MGKILSIDYGEVRVGLAMSDMTNTIATGLDTLVIDRDKTKLYDRIKEILENNNIDKIVIGYPKNMNGTLSKKTEEVDEVIEMLSPLGIEIVKWDERLTTVSAYSTMKALGIKQTQKNKYADKLAATSILQDYLDYLRR